MYINISTVGARPWMGKARGGTEQRVTGRPVTFTRSYCAAIVILLPRFVQTDSCVRLFFTLLFEILSRRMSNIVRNVLYENN